MTTWLLLIPVCFACVILTQGNPVCGYNKDWVLLMGLSYEHRVKEAKSRGVLVFFVCFFFVNFPLFHVYLVCEREFRPVWLFKHDQTLAVCNITFILMSGL